MNNGLSINLKRKDINYEEEKDKFIDRVGFFLIIVLIIGSFMYDNILGITIALSIINRYILFFQ